MANQGQEAVSSPQRLSLGCGMLSDTQLQLGGRTLPKLEEAAKAMYLIVLPAGE